MERVCRLIISTVLLCLGLFPGSQESHALPAGKAGSARYAAHSVLSEGTWVKIRIPESGIYQLTPSFVRQCGFSDLSKVRVYGYGGALQPERLTGDYLTATDDLQELPVCTVGDRRLFYGVGPVTWDSAEALTRRRNNYADYGCYFLTEGIDEPFTLSQDDFKSRYYPLPADYHTLYEVDDYAWFHGGRNLYDKTLYTIGRAQTYTLAASAASATLTVVLSYDASFEAMVSVNDSLVGHLQVDQTFDQYTKAAEKTWTFALDGLKRGSNTVAVTQTSGGNLRLDYLALTSGAPADFPDLPTTTFDTPTYVGRIANQDHHADGTVDMVILIPASQKWRSEAERLQTLHKTKDGLRVRIVPADELYNEFSSGTPDANAYRRYLKMLYDRAETTGDAPRYLLLYGDGAWDNRLNSTGWTGYSADDFLLCYESENSFSEIDCYVSDDYFCLLDDEEQIQQASGSGLTYLGKPDVAVGRLPVRTLAEAKIMADKITGYADNAYAGAWQNTICVMGDDGNNNSHMVTADKVATLVGDNYPGYYINKVYWDAYARQTSSTGNSYPDVTTLLKAQMAEGALMMNYSGHGAPYALSHELVLRLADFAEGSSMRMPLWMTASCDIMPFDGQEDNIGETALLNDKGGAIAFFGTTRTVYAHYNELMNLSFTNYVLSAPGGVRMPMGEAVRRAKCDLVENGTDTTPNKLQYTLLGDPALALALPTQEVVVDEINGQPIDDVTTVQLSAGSIATIKGHVVGGSSVDTGFNGVVAMKVCDAEETIVCRLNNTDDTDNAFSYQDHTKVIYNGADSVRNGAFSLTFAVPKDISYTEGNGLVTFYALSADKTQTAHGEDHSIVLNGSGEVVGDSIGPSIHCYLNTPSFRSGDKVNRAPYFVAELYDDSGINASGSSVGHDLELIIDGELSRTYNLNSAFAYDFGDYRSGKVGFSIPELADGTHTLLFRAWDVQNNSSTAELTFEVVKEAALNCLGIDCRRNAATGGVTFTVTHDRAGSEIRLTLDVFDVAGRQLWQYREKGVSADNTYTFDWNINRDGGRRLQAGVYLFRITIATSDGAQATKTKKLMVAGNN